MWFTERALHVQTVEHVFKVFIIHHLTNIILKTEISYYH